MSRPPCRSRVPIWVIPLLIAILLAPALPTAAQTGQEDDETIVPVVISLSLSDVIEPGRSWFDDEGLHLREIVTTLTVDGDLSGTADLIVGIDWFGPCDQEMLVCDGGQDVFADVTLSAGDGRWSGTLAIESAPGTRSEAHGILIGRHGTGDQVLVLDDVTILAEDGVIELSGRMVTLSGPIGGIHLIHSACITGPATADGGFIGTRGLILDSGPARIVREPVGGAQPMGIYGEVRQIGQKGNLRGIFTAVMNDQHSYGSFVLAGESGPYRGVLGYGRATATVTDEPLCQSGVQITSTWTGQVRYLTDPASFLAPRVYFGSPADEAVVSSPVALDLVAEHVTIEQAGEARDGAGYFTVIVDAPCIGPGEPVPIDDQHIHLTEGETSLDLSLFSGQHRLCLQLTDGAGIAQPANDVITIVVAAAAEDGPDN
ncbi:hypothetical protein BH23CHL2_BH23CHL2_22950 [soil metagenome]